MAGAADDGLHAAPEQDARRNGAGHRDTRGEQGPQGPVFALSDPAATRVDPPADRASAWVLALLGVTLVPVLVGIWLGSAGVVLAVGSVAAATVIVLAWRRGGRPSRRETAMLGLAALVCVPTGLTFAVLTLLGGLAALTALRRHGYAVAWRVRRPWWLTVVATGVVGAGLAVVNVALARASGVTSADTAPVLGLLGAARAGLSEEIGMRAFLLTCAVVVLGHPPVTLAQRVSTYLVMVVPHAAVHASSFADLLAQTLVLGVLFGLPLTLLMTRFGVLAAVVAHTVIDAVRFLVIGV